MIGFPQYAQRRGLNASSSSSKDNLGIRIKVGVSARIFRDRIGVRVDVRVPLVCLGYRNPSHFVDKVQSKVQSAT